MKIFIDGEHGTTGLQIRSRLAGRQDLTILSLSEEERRNVGLRMDYLRAADIAVLCLPDAAAREAVQHLAGYPTRIIDSSTAHRTASDWVYGFAELTKGQKQRIRAAQHVSNPGCYATGALALIRPLREAGLLTQDYPIAINAVSGYSGGGKQLIARMENKARPDAINARHFLYGLALDHKHLPEIILHGQLSRTPVFTPSVGRFAQGMVVCIPLHLRLMAQKAGRAAIYETLRAHYCGQNVIEVAPEEVASSLERINAEERAGTDRLKIYVTGSPDGEIVNLVAVLDNLGKGAAGAAVQNLDLMLES